MIYCIEEFKKEVESLSKNNSYKNLKKEIIALFNNKSVDDFKGVGSNLTNSSEVPYIKKRLNGSGGYRIYFLLILLKDNIHLVYVHPKTGSDGFDVLGKNKVWELYKEVHEKIINNELYEVTFDLVQNDILFKALQPINIPDAKTKKPVVSTKVKKKKKHHKKKRR